MSTARPRGSNGSYTMPVTFCLCAAGMSSRGGGGDGSIPAWSPMNRDVMLGLMGMERDVRSNCVRNIGSLRVMGATNRDAG